jgi:exodeoxyribonuclease-1
MPVLRIGQEVRQPNVSVCFDLSHDLASFRNLTDAQLQNRVASSPKPLRKIKDNAAPTMTALQDAPAHLFGDLTHDDVIGRAAELQSDEALIARLLGAYEASKTEFDASPHVEQQIYGGEFPTPADEQLMVRFHDTPWNARHALADRFLDPKFSFMAKRLIFAHDPNCLPQEHRQEIDAHVASRLLVPDDSQVKWTTLTKARAECAKMLASADAGDLSLLEGYGQYLDDRITSLTISLRTGTLP